MTAAAFEAERARLIRLAYRMTGTMAEAEDLVQETYLRWHGTSAAEIRSPAAWLTTTLTRLAIDHLRARKNERARYVGPWLPEPILDEPGDRVGDEGRAAARIELADDLSLAFLMVMDNLPPAERAAFLLHDAFGHDHDSVATILGKSPAAVRQLVSRGRARLKAARPDIHVPKAARDAIANRFIDALINADGAALAGIMHQDAILLTDGGGKRSAALNPIYGADKILRFFAGIARKIKVEVRFERTLLNGAPGLVAIAEGEIWFALVPDVQEGSVGRIMMVRNPDKLSVLTAAFAPGPLTRGPESDRR
ncbi:sigma-70 family RNA polymerase sigma factor [Oleomonas cavernae]|uniref:Sigma-70 family RNA polymerase sigma factor n=1 Tax=Oleomonas cavernae TaxID=2320859 RepID=A0A418WAJ4_9PROT|nr:RNA polymerase sigma factor SigJ [Oleomonas cavernae]RJF87067.1 sigma-70 family RNA polymerase sigma factor [Oleomonas cavernae]